MPVPPEPAATPVALQVKTASNALLALDVYKLPQAPPIGGENGDGQSERGDSEFGKSRA